MGSDNTDPRNGTVKKRRRIYDKSVAYKITIQFPRDQFDTLTEQAKRQKVSFAELIRTYAEWGLEAENVVSEG